MAKAKGKGAAAQKTGTVTKLVDVANAFGVKRQTVKGWSSDGMPGSPGKYDLAEIAKWKAKRPGDPEQRKLRDESGSLDERIERERLRKLRAQADKAEREEEEAQSRMISADQANSFFAAFFTELTTQLGKIPEELKPGLPEAVREELAATIEQRINITLRQMGAWGQQLGRA